MDKIIKAEFEKHKSDKINYSSIKINVQNADKNIEEVKKVLGVIFNISVKESYDASVKSIFKSFLDKNKTVSNKDVLAKNWIEMSESNSKQYKFQLFQCSLNISELNFDIIDKEYFKILEKKMVYNEAFDDVCRINETVFSRGSEHQVNLCQHDGKRYVIKTPLERFNRRLKSQSDLSSIFLSIHFTKELLKIFNSRIEKYISKEHHFVFANTYCGKLKTIGTPKFMNDNIYFFIEEFIDDFCKYSNNAGFVKTDLKTNKADTSKLNLMAQAFSHFTFDFSSGNILICDIQGNMIMTDIAIHSISEVFGILDAGRAGFKAFFQSHECNGICRHLNLPDYKVMPKIDENENENEYDE